MKLYREIGSGLFFNFFFFCTVLFLLEPVKRTLVLNFWDGLEKKEAANNLVHSVSVT